MAKEKPEYEINEEFNKKAVQIIEKYTSQFYGIQIDKVRCVNIVNKERPNGKKSLWAIEAVKMPVALDCIFSHYVILYSADWDSYSEKQKLLLIADVLHGIPRDEENNGKVISCDTKGYASMFRTFKGIDFLEDPDAPNILEEDIEWR